MQSKLPLVLLVMIFAVAFWEPRSALGASGSWFQSTQADFASGTMNNLIYAGGLKLASGGSLALMGFSAISRDSGLYGGSPVSGNTGETIIQVSPGTAAPEAGSLVGFSFYMNSLDSHGGAAFQLKVFRDNGTAYLFVGGSGSISPSVGRNYVSLGQSPLLVRRGDLIGFWWMNSSLSGDIIASCTGYSLLCFGVSYNPDVYNHNRVVGYNVATDTSKSSWSSSAGGSTTCLLSNCATYTTSFLFSVEANFLPIVYGSYVSSVKDTGGFSSWGTITWHGTIPSNTNLALSTRSSNDSVNWSAWSPATNTSSVASPAARYIQYNASLGALGELTPILKDVTINFNTMAPAWPAPSTLAAAAINRTTVILVWSPATGNLAPASYRVYKGNTLLATVPGTQYAYTVGGLMAGTTYTFSVQAGDAANDWSTNGPSATLTTPTASTSPTIVEPATLLAVSVMIAGSASLAVAYKRTRKLA